MNVKSGYKFKGEVFLSLLLFVLLSTVGVRYVYAAPLDVIINQSSAQSDPTTSPNIRFTVVFSDPINVATFDAGDITLAGTAPRKMVTSINEISPNDGTTFEVIVNTTGLGTVIASIPLGSSSSVILGATGQAPYAITIDSLGNIYTANYNSNNVTKITPDGTSTIFGTTGPNPSAITIDSLGNVYTSNYGNDTVTKITPDGTSTIFGTTGSGPEGIAVDTLGNVYTSNNNVDNVTKITPDGTSTIFGTTGSGVVSLAIDSLGSIYTSDYGNDTVTKITPDGTSTIFGTTGSLPFGIVIDSAGNIYTSNSGSNNVTKITPDGTSTIFGTTGSLPFGIVIDSAGNIYTANYNSNNVTKITPDGTSTIFGTTGLNPQGIVLDDSGNVYTENYSSEDVSKMANTGILDLSGINLNTVSVSTDNTVTRSTDYSVSPTSITVGENLGTGTFNVVLLTQPVSEVVMSVTSSSLPDATVSPAVLTFTNSDWNVPQVVTVTGVDDSLTSNDVATITVSVIPELSDDTFDLLTSRVVGATLSNDDVLPPTPITSGGGGAVLTLDVLRSLNRNTPPQIIAEVKIGELNVPSEFAPYVCKRYLKSYIYPNKNNNVDDVKKLQIFLNTTQGANLAVDGMYKIVDVDAVKRYQLKYTDQILAPWGLRSPTGIVYTTTTAKINLMSCQGEGKTMYFKEYLKEGDVSLEVVKLQDFLNLIFAPTVGYPANEIPLSKEFTKDTAEKLKEYQRVYKETVLKPWNLKTATGWFYKTTRKSANLLMGYDEGDISLGIERN